MQPSKNTLNDIKNSQTAWLWYGLSVLVVGIDQLSKIYFENNFQLYQTVSVIEPIFNFTLAHNYGAAFSFLADQGGWQRFFFSGLAFGVCGFIIVYLRRLPRDTGVLSAGLALIMAGALGNLMDRVRLGYVVDFLHVHYANVWNFPIFNLADVAINLGVVLVLIDSFFLEAKRRKPPMIDA